MIASAVAPVPPHQPSVSSPKPRPFRGLSQVLRRAGQNRSNPNSPPTSPPEGSTLERSTSYPLALGSSINVSSSNGNNNGNSNSSSGAGVVGQELVQTVSGGTHPPTTSVIAAGRPNASTAAISASTTASQQASIRGKKSSNNLAPESLSTASSGMARLRRAFSSQNGSQPAQATSPASAPANAAPIATPTSPPTDSADKPLADINGAGRDGLAPDQMPTIKFIPHQDPRSSKPSLAFAATSRTLPHEDCVIRVGRYSERDGPQNPPPGVPSAAPVGFKSKVVSRKHCEFWCSQGQWYIKDIKSSSGTFLNHIRLSQPNLESRPFPINDGDVVQLGIDFKGGEEAIFRCVKIRIECNRSWQKKLNDFNMNTHKKLRELNKTTSNKDVPGQTNECSICLMSIAPCQSLFVAPCSHVWHFKCIRPMLDNPKTYPQFICPNCRAVTDLEADIEEIEWDQEVDGQQDTDEAVSTTSAPEETASAASAAGADSSSGPAELPSTQADGERITAAVGSLELADSSIDAALHGQTAPVEVPGSSAQSLRPVTPGGAAELAGNEGPLTPRNDAGPFVFDGSGATNTPRRIIPGMAQSLEANGAA